MGWLLFRDVLGTSAPCRPSPPPSVHRPAASRATTPGVPSGSGRARRSHLRSALPHEAASRTAHACCWRSPTPTPPSGGRTTTSTAPGARKRYPGRLIATGRYGREEALRAVESGSVDAVGFGRDFIANPDLPERLARDAEPREALRPAFFGGDDRGYLEVPPPSMPSAFCPNCARDGWRRCQAGS